MSADARILLRAAANERAKTSASGISDPFASYSASGGLRCSACNYLTIKHESLWGAHVLSKNHRSNVARIREEELRQAEIQRTKDGKRKAENSEPSLNQGKGANTTADVGTGQDDAEPESKKVRTEPTYNDSEWELFKSEMEASEPRADEPVESYGAGAALEAEAQLISRDNTDLKAVGVGDEAEEKTVEEIEATERARKEQEEREEILARMEEEQRQQDEADQR